MIMENVGEVNWGQVENQGKVKYTPMGRFVVCGGKKGKRRGKLSDHVFAIRWGFKPISPGSKIQSPKNLPLLFFFFPQFSDFFSSRIIIGTSTWKH